MSYLLPFFACFHYLNLLTHTFCFFLQLTDSFWKPALETEKGKGSTSAAAETVDDEESSEESSKEAAAGDENEDEESSPEAPTVDVFEEESSSEAQYVDEEHSHFH